MAQTVILDSLKAELKKSLNDTLKTDLLNNIGVEYLFIQPDSAKAYINQAYDLAIEKDYRRGEAISLNYLGRYYSNKGQYANALDYLLRCLSIQDYSDVDRVAVVTYYDLGQLYAALRMFSGSDELFHKEILYIKKSIEALHQLSPEKRKGDLLFFEAAAFNALGQAFLGRSDPVRLDSAFYFFTKAADMSNNKTSFEVLFAAREGIANVYMARSQYEEARHVGHLLLSMSKEHNRMDHHKAGALMKLGNYHQRDNFDSARYYFNEALSEFRLLGKEYQLFIPAIYSQLGQLNFHNKYYNEAIKWFAREIEITKELGAKENGIAYLLISESYKALGNYKMAYEFQSSYHRVKDSLYNEDTSSKLATVLSDFEATRQQSQIDLLKEEARVKELLLSQKQTQQILILSLAILLFVVIIFLVSRNRWIQRAKEEQEKLFKELDRLKSRFFANISHEFRTPLTLLLGPIEKHLVHSGNDEDKSEFKVMHRNASRLLRLVNQLLDLSRFEAGTMKLQASQNDCISFTTTIMSEFQSIADSRNIQFVMKRSLEAIDLYFDPDKLEKILNNLFSNAFKFTPEGGHIIVEISQHGKSNVFKEGFVEFTVTDTGIGIASEHLPNLFDRFYQVDGSTTRAFEGSGIGLALTKELVELHHGIIIVRSQLGEGASFTVQLPLGNSHLSKDEISTVGSYQPSEQRNINEGSSVLRIPQEWEQGELVLVIEDNVDLREHLFKELSPMYRIVLAKDGAEGIDVALKEIPSLVISDLMMPKRDGLEVCTILKEDERTSHIPFILLTAKAETQSRIDGFRKGADDYIAKPFSINELLVRVENLIEGRKKLQKKYTQNIIAFKPNEAGIKSVEEKFLNKVAGCMEANIADPLFSVESFARELGMSQVQLYRKLLALTGYSPNEFIRHMRLERAADLLKKKAGNVSEIAYQSGFNNLSYFSKVFREKFGVTPSEYTKQSI